MLLRRINPGLNERTPLVFHGSVFNFNVSAKSDALQVCPPFTQTWTMSQVVRLFCGAG